MGLDQADHLNKYIKVNGTQRFVGAGMITVLVSANALGET